VPGNLARRIAFAAVAIPAVVGIAYLGRWAFAALLAAAALLGAREVYAFARAQGVAPIGWLGLAGAAGMPLAVTWVVLAPSRPSLALVREGYLLMLWLLLVMAVALWRRGPGERPLTAVAVTVFGALYAGWLLSFAVYLRHPAPARFANDAAVGLPLLLYPLVLTWVGDTAAMAAGTAIGGRKLAPVLSPNKTWAGGIAGLLATTLISVVYAAVVFPRAGIAVSLAEGLGFGVAISLAGQAGDVAESLLKREAGVKDSSAIIPGHGGVLDRLDSLYFAVPVAALLLRQFGIL